MDGERIEIEAALNLNIGSITHFLCVSDDLQLAVLWKQGGRGDSTSFEKLHQF